MCLSKISKFFKIGTIISKHVEDCIFLYPVSDRDFSALRMELATRWLNNWMKKNKKGDRYMTWFDVIKVSGKAHDRINKIIKEGR